MKTFHTRRKVPDFKKEPVQLKKEGSEKGLIPYSTVPADNTIAAQPPEFYTVQEVSKILKVDDRTVSRRIKKGAIKAMKDGGKHLIYKNEFDIYLRNNSIEPNQK